MADIICRQLSLNATLRLSNIHVPCMILALSISTAILGVLSSSSICRVDFANARQRIEVGCDKCGCNSSIDLVNLINPRLDLGNVSTQEYQHCRGSFDQCDHRRRLDAFLARSRYHDYCMSVPGYGPNLDGSHVLPFTRSGNAATTSCSVVSNLSSIIAPVSVFVEDWFWQLLKP